MEQIQFSEQDILMSDRRSQVVETNDYSGRSDYDALAESMNSLYAGIKRREFDKMDVDTSSYKDMPFSHESFMEAIGKEDEDISVKLMDSNINNWQDYERRKAYLKHYKETQEQVANNFSTAGMIAAGIPMALLDVDALLINPTLSGVSKVNKALNLQTKMSKVASHVIAGGLVGAESMATYELATGVYEDNSITNSALMGMALGGSLGMFIERNSIPKEKWKDANDAYVDPKAAKEEALNKAAIDLQRTNEAISIQEHIKNNVKTEAKGILQGLKDNVKEATAQIKGFKTARDTIIKETKDTTLAINKLLKEKEDTIARAQEYAETMAKYVEARSNGKGFKRLEAKIDKLKKQGIAFSKKKDREIRTLTKIVKDNNVMLKNSQAEQIRLEKQVELSTKALKDKDLTTTAEKYLDKDKFKQLLAKRGLLTQSIADIEADKLDLIGLRKEKQNYVDKLTKELEDANTNIATLDNIKNNSVISTLPEWAKKMLISPIEKILNDSNPLVSGFGALLHSGTIHHGKVNTRTAHRIRQEYDEQLERVITNLRGYYTEAKAKGYKGSKQEFELEVAQEARFIVGQMQRDMNKGIPAGTDELARSELVISKASSVEKKYKNMNPAVRKGADEVLGYFEAIAKSGKDIDMSIFKHVPGKGYMNRIYSKEKIEKLGGRLPAIERLVEAQKSYAISNGLPMTQEIIDGYRASATKAVDSTLDKTNVIKSITEPFGKPIRSNPSVFKQRSIEAFDDDLADLLDDDIIGNMHVYALSTHGRLALKEKIGVENSMELDDVIEKLGADTKQKDRIRVIVDSILGTREITKDPFNPAQRVIKAVSSYSSLVHTAAFGVPTLTEVASIAKEFGWGNTMKNLIPSAREIKDIYLKGTPSDKNKIELMGAYGDPYFANRANRHDVENAFEATNIVQEKVDGMVHRLSFLGGLMPITDTLKMTTITSAVDFLASMSIKADISKTDLMRVNDMGFDANDLKLIRDTLKVGHDGKINNIDRKSWGKLDQRITDGVMTMLERTILHPNGATLPMFMTDANVGSWMSKIVMKFMRFPFESYERLLIRGVQEADAKQLIALGGNIAMWSLLLSAKDALKEEDRQKYNGDDGVTELMKDSLLYNSWTAFPVSMSDVVYGGITGENLTNDYRHRILGVTAGDMESLQKGNPRISLPFYNLNLGDAFARFQQDILGLDELTKEE